MTMTDGALTVIALADGANVSSTDRDSACAPKPWNSLPSSLRDPTLTLFCRRLKIYLIGLAYGCSLVTVYAVKSCALKILSYIHTYIHTVTVYQMIVGRKTNDNL